MRHVPPLHRTRISERPTLRIRNSQPRQGPDLQQWSPKYWRNDRASDFGLENAQLTLRATTQKGVRNIQGPVHRRFISQPYHQKQVLLGKWYSDTAFFKIRGIGGETCAQVTTNGFGCGRFLPLRTKKEASDGLSDLINNQGVPEHLVTDGSREQGGHGTHNTGWNKLVKKYHIQQSFTEPYSWWQNLAEQEIREVKRQIRR
jgi:hypothetical protein